MLEMLQYLEVSKKLEFAGHLEQLEFGGPDNDGCSEELGETRIHSTQECPNLYLWRPVCGDSMRPRHVYKNARRLSSCPQPAPPDPPALINRWELAFPKWGKRDRYYDIWKLHYGHERTIPKKDFNEEQGNLSAILL